VNSNENNNLKAEWSVLQNQVDSYEKYSLFIKLANVVLLSLAYFTNSLSIFVIFLLIILWLQDAIWKTYQSRLEYRLLQIENSLLNGVGCQAFQINSDFQNNRAGFIQLLSEYLHQAIRPTVAYPHVVLVLMMVIVIIK
jgi:hypothetical protein